MEETNFLNQFRDKWKKELQSKPDSKVEGEKQGVQLENKPGENSTEGKSYFDSTRKTQIETAESKASYTCLTYTFKPHKRVCDPDCSVAGSAIPSHINEVSIATGKSDKRKCKINTLGSKKTKVSKLDDIFSEKAKGVLPKERLLDQLIQDIDQRPNMGSLANSEDPDEMLHNIMRHFIRDEITAIPFFDISIPKEVAINIFQFLDIKDLCICAQVSKSWRVLSEDELLWCRICHRLGRETIYTTREKQNWKTIVQHNVERQRRLMSNWKERIGKLSQLEHIRGKILCSVNSYKEKIVAGYSTGEVKYWDLTSGDSCVLQPSNTSLRLLDDYETGTVQNTLQSVVTSDSTIAALYSQGNVEIWNLDKGTQAVQAYSPSTSQFQVSCLRMSNNSHTLVTKYGHFLDVLHRQDPEGEFDLHTHFTTETRICDIKLLEIDREIPPVVLSKLCSVSIFHPKQSEDLLTVAKDKSDQLSHMTEIHSRIDIPVSQFDIKVEPALVAIALGSSSCDEEDWFKIYLYDLQTCKLTQSLQSYGTYGGCSMNTTCMNLADSPPNELIIAQTDKKLHIYDLRQGIRIQTLEGHPQKITRVQMDDWKVVSGGAGSYCYGSVVYIWDRRMGKKLWDLHNRHPVEYCHFRDKHLIVGNVPVEKHPRDDEFEVASHRKYRGSIHVYDFLEDLTTQDVPEICLSTYDQPGASHYNIGLAMPYDTLNF